MYNIEYISKKVTSQIKNQLNLNEEKSIIIEYGLHAFFHMMISIILVVIIGKIFNVMLESLIISFVISILRRSSGGAHASTSLNCAIIGTLISVIPAIMISKSTINFEYVKNIGMVIFVFSIIVTYKLAPVDTPNKPIRSEKKIKRLKRGSMITLMLYIIIVICNILIYSFNKNSIFLIYSLCIYIGTAWQVFTLTKLGHLFIKLLDCFLIKLLEIKGE